MALGGGNYVSQNKVLPGSYINVVSAEAASSELSDRGIVAIPLQLKWGKEGEVIGLTSNEFKDNCFKLFGYDYTHAEMKPLREVYKNAIKAYIYKLGTGVKASCTYCDAKYAGARGNSINIVISVNVDDATKSDVKTYVDTVLVDSQTVLTSGKTDVLVDNDWVVWKDNVALTATAGTALTTGANATVTGTDHTTALAALESVAFNVLASDTSDDTTKGLYAAYTKRMRDELGIKFQCVLHKYATADHEGIISVENNTTTECVYWVAGAVAGVAINKSLTNKLYDGEYAITTVYTQTQLEDAIKAGKFIMHKVGDGVRILKDINTLITITANKGNIFKDNQTVRIIDQIANDVATLFNTKYLGVVPNDAAGRTSFWVDVVKHHNELQSIRAIENFEDKDITVSQGSTKQSIVVTDAVTPINSMTQLYMTCVVQ